MDRILQPHSGAPPSAQPAPVRPMVVPHHVVGSPLPGAPPKAAGDFFRALKRRFWVVLIVALAVGGSGTAWVIRLPDVYRAMAQILIEPPRFDAGLATLMPNGAMAAFDRESNEKYVPNKIAQLRSRSLAEEVTAQSTAQPFLSGLADPAGEIMGGLQPRQLPNTTYFDIAFESTDPERASGLLNETIAVFQRRAKTENSAGIEESLKLARASLKSMNADLARIDEGINKFLVASPMFAPGGRSRYEEEYQQINTILTQKRLKLDEIAQEDRLARLFPNMRRQPTGLDQQIAELKRYKKQLVGQLENLQRMTVNFDRDPSSKHVAKHLSEVMDELEELERAAAGQGMPDVTGATLALADEEVHKLEQKAKSLLDRMQNTMPMFQNYLSMLKDRDSKAVAIAAMSEKLLNYDMLAKTLNDPVKVQLKAVVPTSPVRPKRSVTIVLFSVLGVALGAGLVCLLEFLDRSVKVPEHLTAGLGLAVLGVVPRMRRLSRLQRGGHLWTPGIPESVEADAYRNLRASLLSIPGRNGPMVTLLVTSAKAGEGKSTTALNLAATCARAGERTLLIDADLRRPSLVDVFADLDDERADLGLVDVLRGDLPWQRTVVRTDIANLDFLPTGDPSGIPIEILGSLELRQLVLAVSGHYDRVIIDGPAILGLADCRMLGRLVDSSLMVVRSGAHELRPLQRAKAMLEQSRVPIAGVVFNGLTDDLDNWSSYGPGIPYTSPWTGREPGLPMPEEAEEPVTTPVGQLGA